MPWWNHQHALQAYYHEADRLCGGPSSSNLAYDNTLATHRPLAQHTNVLYGMTSIRLELSTKKLGACPATHWSGMFLHVWCSYRCKVLWPTVLRQLLRKKSARSGCWCSLDDWLQSIAIMVPYVLRSTDHLNNEIEDPASKQALHGILMGSRWSFR